MKAFLSHSSRDKEFVGAVAKELGRQFCIFDEQVFSTGEEFKKSIEHGLDESAVFVLFASRAALESVWVKFEIDEAWYKKLRNTISRSLVYILDSSIDVDDLPEWLRRALMRRENSPKTVARDIRYHLNQLLLERQHPYFVGRTADIEKLETVMTPVDGSPAPHVLFITGLPGIGRRSLIRRATPNILNLRKQLEIRLGEGDSINDICVSVADHIEPYSTKERFEEIIKQIQSLSDHEATKRTISNLRSLVSAGDLPVFVDDGGLLDDEGYIRGSVESLLNAIPPNDTAYLFFVSARRPQSGFEQGLPILSLERLNEDDTKRLIAMLATKSEIQVSPANVTDLATYVAGYPPSAYFAIQQAKDYGLDLVLREKASLVEFRTAVFLKHLSGIALEDYEQSLLRVLATFSPLPLAVLAETLELEPQTLHKSLIRLIDLALMATTDEGFYRIADPIADAALKAFGYPTEQQNRSVATNLVKFLAESEIESSRLILSRVLFRAALWANEKGIADSAIHLANDLIRLTESFYHERQYDRAIEFGITVLEDRPESTTARSYLIRALIQEERWEEAEQQLSGLQKYSPIREVYFLTGFLEKKRGRYTLAIESYHKAEEAGRRGAAINRDLAHCYFLIGKHEEAAKYIKEALRRHGADPYVVDLWVQISSRLRDEKSARRALAQLEVLDDPQYYQHRLSRVELAFGNLPAALSAARQAVGTSQFPHFEALANLVFCEIESGNLAEADGLLAKLDQQFGNRRRDIRVALRCRLEIARDNFAEALLQSDRIMDKTTIYYKRIRHDALLGEIKHSVLKDTVRSSYELEADKLLAELAPNSEELMDFEGL